MKWFEFDGRLAAAGFKVFTDLEFQAVTGAGPVSAKFLLIRYTKKGLLCRLKRGLYAAKGRMPSPWAIANQLYKPSYISMESALSYHRLIPETVYALTSVTTKSTREFEADGRAYVYHSIKRCAFSGYRGYELGGENVLMAEKEKALADYLYFVFLRKKSLNERLAMDRIDKTKLVEHLRAFDNPEFARWFKHDLQVPDRRIAR